MRSPTAAVPQANYFFKCDCMHMLGVHFESLFETLRLQNAFLWHQRLAGRAWPNSGKVAGHHAQQNVDLQPKNDTFLGIMPRKVSVPGRTCTFLGIMPSNAWGLQAEWGMFLGMMPSNAPGLH